MEGKNRKKMVPEEGLARLGLHPPMASAFAAGIGSSALPCVALFLANRSVPLRAHIAGYPRECNSLGSGAILPRSSPSMSTRLERKRVREFP